MYYKIINIQIHKIMTKYELTEETIKVGNSILHRIRLIEDCVHGSAGDLGGFIEHADNLSGNAWVSGDAKISGNAEVSGNAKISKTADYMTISSLGINDRTITITFSDKMISAGCFRGTLSELTDAVNQKYGKDSNYHAAIRFITELFK